MISGYSHRVASRTQFFGQNQNPVAPTASTSTLAQSAVKTLGEALPGVNVEVGSLGEKEQQKKIGKLSLIAQGSLQSVRIAPEAAEKMARDTAFRDTVLKDVKAALEKSAEGEVIARGVEVGADGTVSPWTMTTQEYKDSQKIVQALSSLQGNSTTATLLDSLSANTSATSAVSTGVLDNYSQMLGLKKQLASVYGSSGSSSNLSTLA